MTRDSVRGSCQGKSHHREIDRILPWYANNTLDDGDREQVEHHLAECARCREEVTRCRQVANTMREIGDVAPEPHPVQLARLMRQIDQHSDQHSDRHRDQGRGTAGSNPTLATRLKRHLRDLFTGEPRGLRWALAAQSALLALLAVALLRTGVQDELPLPAPSTAGTVTRTLYRTLSDREDNPGTATALGAEQALLRVVFDPDLSEQAIRDTLLELRAEIVGGPSTLGVYTLAVPTQGAGATPVEELLVHLREHAGVRFAQPVATASDGGR